jgi:hypothetical protein
MYGYCVCVYSHTLSIRSILTAKCLIHLYHAPLGFLHHASHVIPSTCIEFLLHLHSVDTIFLYGFPIERKYATFHSPFNLTNGTGTQPFSRLILCNTPLAKQHREVQLAITVCDVTQYYSPCPKCHCAPLKLPK